LNFSPADSAPALRVRQLHKTYDNGVQALKGVSLDVAPGDFFALLGPNGAGKSTLIGIVSSLVNLSEGQVQVFATDLVRERGAAMQLIGLVPQEINFNLFEKPYDILVNYAGFYGVPRVEAGRRAEAELRRAHLWDKAQMMSRTLSGGMKRRLMIARAMMTRPRLLILDEPTAGVDIEIRRDMWRTLREINAAGTTIILTTHYLEEAESLCRNLAIINHGRIVEQGPMRELLAKLDVEGFVLDVDGQLPAQLPEIAGVSLQAVDAHTLELDMPRAMDLNRVFAALGEHGIRVRSMRTKSNRLEELFVATWSKPHEHASHRRRAIHPSTPLDRAGHHRAPRNHAHPAHLGPDPGAAGDHHDPVLPDLRQSDRLARGADGRHRLLMSVIQNSYGNISSSFFGAKFGRHIEELLVSPMPNWVILWGYVAGAVLRGLMVGVIVLLIAMCFTPLQIPHPLVTLSTVLLGATIFSLAGFINAVYARKFDDVAIVPTFILTPLTYLGGVFYSVKLLPGWAEAATHANPIFYMVNAFRYGLLGSSDVPLWMAYTLMLGFVVALAALAQWLLRRGVGLRS
jgi:ABC-2 type transport system ATP-binding protein